ncbi:MAG: right-handed parallel beta-helix repeat-containing protein [Thermoanaerobaculia bacterium]
MKRFAGLVLAAAAAQAPAATFTVTNVNDSGAGSLRQAILDSNGTFGNDDIAFSIPGAGVHTIALASGLPPIIQAVTIDGYTQPGSSANTNPTGQELNTLLQIEIDGTGAGLNPCLQVLAGNDELLVMIIQGLVINRCESGAIHVGGGGDGAFLIGNFLGTDPTGTSVPGPQSFGVRVQGAPGVVIGGTTPFERNLISGNSDAGIIGENAGFLTLRGNLIGTNAAGTASAAPADFGDGVRVNVSSNIAIGGSSAGARNVISGLGGAAIAFLLAPDASSTIQGNLIGTDVTGTLPLGNQAGIEIDGASPLIKGNVVAASSNAAIRLTASSSVIQGNFIGTDETATLHLGNPGGGIHATEDNGSITVGGALPGEGNVIAHNGRFVFAFIGGIRVDGSTVRIRGNRIFDNFFLGIDLIGGRSGGVSGNDPGDLDGGPNDGQNFPIITSVVPGAGTTHIEGFLNSLPFTTFDVDLFSNPLCLPRPQSFLQGENYLGSLPVTTDGSGNATFATDVPFVLQAGQPVSATATDPAGKTSEFSQRILFKTEPVSGPAEGGTSSDLIGMLFEAGATVTVGAVPATGIDVVDEYFMTATMPALPPGSVNDVTVLNPSGLNGTLRNGWVADFLDVPAGHTFHDFVVRLVANGVAAGVGGGLFGVDSGTSRQQMAVFLLKGKHGICYVPPPCAGVFGDVPCPSLFADWIEALAAEGITGGCGGGNYCPGSPVRRDQMAVFLLKAKYGPSFVPAPCAGTFPDVACPSTFADWIERLAVEQITGGCGGGNYCPLSSNTRGQMAVFVVKTFGLF